MSKKRKKAPKKKPPLKVTTRHKRNTKAKTIEFVKGKKDPEKVVKSLEAFDWNKFNYLRMKNKPDGHHHKPPQGITVIVTIKKGKNLYYFTRLSPYDFVVNKQSVKDFTTQTVNELLEQWGTLQDGMEDDENDGEPDGVVLHGSDDPGNLDPGFIVAVTVRFFYGKDPVTGENYV